MTQLRIRVYPDPLLRKKALPIKDITEEDKRLAHDMLETMRQAQGIGLAAPQIGIHKRMIVIEAIEDDRSPKIFINPVILRRKGSSTFCEGCLSIPGIHSEVIRPSSVVIEALDLEGRKIVMESDGLLARVVQHEIDHLDGILFIDRLGFFERKKVLRQIRQNVCIDL